MTSGQRVEKLLRELQLLQFQTARMWLTFQKTTNMHLIMRTRSLAVLLLLLFLGPGKEIIVIQIGIGVVETVFADPCSPFATFDV